MLGRCRHDGTSSLKYHLCSFVIVPNLDHYSGLGTSAAGG